MYSDYSPNKIKSFGPTWQAVNGIETQTEEEEATESVPQQAEMEDSEPTVEGVALESDCKDEPQGKARDLITCTLLLVLLLLFPFLFISLSCCFCSSPCCSCSCSSSFSSSSSSCSCSCCCYSSSSFSHISSSFECLWQQAKIELGL